MNPRAHPPRSPPTPAFAWTYLALNLLALPGLGTRLAGRPGGIPQMVLALLGFLGLVAWAMHFLARWVQDGHPAWGGAPWSWCGLAGLALSAASWGWSLASGIAAVRDATRAEQDGAGAPPRLP